MALLRMLLLRPLGGLVLLAGLLPLPSLSQMKAAPRHCSLSTLAGYYGGLENGFRIESSQSLPQFGIRNEAKAFSCKASPPHGGEIGAILELSDVG
jgi:hypothetical protein